MAPKKARPPPPSPSPEPEAEEETSEEESEKEEESEEEQNDKRIPIMNKNLGVQEQKTPPTPAVESSPSEEEDEEGSESGEEEEQEEEEEEEEDPGTPPSPNVSDFTVKPIYQTRRSSITEEDDDEKDSRSSKKVKTNQGVEVKGNGLAKTNPGVEAKGGGLAAATSGGAVDSVKNEEKVDSLMDDISDDEGGFHAKYPNMSLSLSAEGLGFLPPHLLIYLEKKLNLIDSSKGRKWEEEWKEVRVQEAQLYLKKLKLMKEHLELASNYAKKELSGN